MSQKRIQDYGSPVVAQSLKSLTDAITVAGILDGNEFIRDASDRVRINPGTCVTNQGVIIVENEAKILSISNTSNSADYTIYYLHTDVDISGGVAAELTLASGLLDSSVVSGCILGYIRYPGGGVPLDQSFFIQPAPLKIGTVIPTKENAPWLVPINSNGYHITYQSGGTINITNTWDLITPIGVTTPRNILYIKVRNNGVTNGTITLTFPYKVSEQPYALLQTILSTDINALVIPFFIDSDGEVTELVTTPIGGFTGQSEFLLKSIPIPRTTIQISNTIVYLQLQISLASGKEARIQCLGLNTYNLPI